MGDLIISLVIGIVFLLWGAFSVKKTLFYTINGKEVEGVVKEIKDIFGGYIPVVEFNDEYNSGEIITRELDEASPQFDYDIGSKIKLIHYRNQKEDTVFVKSWSHKYLLEVAFIVGGSFTIITALIDFFNL